MHLKELRKLIKEEKIRSKIYEATVADRPSAKNKPKQSAGPQMSQIDAPVQKEIVNQVEYVRGAMRMMNELKINFPQILNKEIPANTDIRPFVDDFLRIAAQNILEDIKSDIKDPEALDILDRYLS